MKQRHMRGLTAIAVCVCILWTPTLAQQGKSMRLRIKTMVGQAKVRSRKSNRWRDARVNMPLRMGMDLRTFVESNVELGYPNGTIVKVGENTVVSLSKLLGNEQDGEIQSDMQVATGQVWANVKKLVSKKSEFSFETPTAVASIRGTKLGINVSNRGTAIDVYEGTVAVRSRGSKKETMVKTKTRAIIKAGSKEVKTVDFAKQKGKTDPDLGAPPPEDIFAEPDSTADTTAAADSTAADSTLADSTLADSTLADSTAADSTAADSTLADSTAADSTGPDSTVSDSTAADTAATGDSITVPDSTTADTAQAAIDSAETDSAESLPGDTTTTVQDTATGGIPDTTATTAPAFSLTITSPQQRSTVNETPVVIKGTTAPGASISAGGGTAATAGPDGAFSLSVELGAGRNTIPVEARTDEASKTVNVLVEYAPPAGTEAAPLNLAILSPRQRSAVNETPVLIKGTTTPGASVAVAGTETPVGPDGSFSAFADLQTGRNTVPVEAQLGGGSKKTDVLVEYRPRLFCTVTNLVDNMEVSADEITLDIEVTEGATYSVNGKEGGATVELTPGPNSITVRAWDQWDNRLERVYSITYVKPEELVLKLASPGDGTTITEPRITVSGSTVPGARVSVNGQNAPVSRSGFFTFHLYLADEEGDYSIDVTAAYEGEELSESRTVTYERPREPLTLTITSPAQDQSISQTPLRVAGKTTAAAEVTVNGRPALVAPDGSFSADLLISERDIGEFTVEVIADDGEDLLTKSIRCVVDVSSKAVNTSVPMLVAQGLEQQAVRLSAISLQVMDRTPEDRITLEITNNGSTETFELDPGGRENLNLEEGLNEYTIQAFDKANNMSNVLSGKIYFLPGPVSIDLNEPSNSPFVIDDMPPMPRGSTAPTMDIEVEIDDNIGSIPETIRYCRIVGTTGSILLDNNGNDYIYSTEIALVPGKTAYVIQAEDMAGNTASKDLTIILKP